MYKQVIFIGGSKLILDCINAFCEEEGHSGITVLFLDVERVESDSKRRLCEKFHIVYHPVKRKDLTDILAGIEDPSLVLSIMNHYILPPEVVKNQNLRIINLHHSSLPGHRGMNAGAWAIYYQETYSGITWHLVNEEVDKGQIIRVTKIPITEDMTAIMLLRKQNIAALRDFTELMDILLYGNETVYEQSEGTDYLHRVHDVPAGGKMDITWSGAQTSAFLRAMDFGVLQVFGKPSVTWEENTYYWKKYLIDRDETIAEDSFSIDEEKKVIVLKKSDGYNITLKGVVILPNDIAQNGK